MHSDIVYEIIRYLHLAPEENGGVLLSRKVLISEKKFRCLDAAVEKIHKPIVFDVCSDLVELRRITTSDEIIIFWGDGEVIKLPKILMQHLSHSYKDTKMHTIKIFGHVGIISLPNQIIDLHSIGNLKDMYRLFSQCKLIHKNIAKKIDTSNVINMTYMFSDCADLNFKIGQNWNTSRVEDLSSMFFHCYNLDKNIGKYWDTSKVNDMSCMFYGCYKLNRNIGKNWNTSKVDTMDMMFQDCRSLDKNIGKNWNTANVKNMNAMFYRCIKLSQIMGKNWKISRLTLTADMFQYCPIQGNLIEYLD